MSTVAKKATCITAIILAFCLLVAALYLLAFPNGYINGKGNNGNGGNGFKPSNIDLKEYSIKMGVAWKGEGFEKTYTGESLPIIGNTDFVIVDADGKDVAWNNVWVYYKEKDADDKTYTAKAPIKVGEYVVKVIVYGDSSYEEFNKTFAYKINKISIPAAVLNSKVYYKDTDGDFCFHKTYTGKRLAITKDDIRIGSDEITDTMQIAYKVKGADDSTYTAKAPIKVGVYEVKIVVPETETCYGYEYIYIYKIEE